MSNAALLYLFHHVFLPPKLPQRSDNGQEDRALLDRLIESVAEFRASAKTEHYKLWSTIHRCLRSFKSLHSTNKSLAKTSLKTALRGAEDGDLIVLHVDLQNSGVIIHKRDVGYVVETFEVSPRAADVLKAQGALEWNFPSRAVIIPPDTFENDTFQDSLAEFIEKASLEPVKQYAASALKAGSQAYESRDTTFPAIIGQLLITILEADGRKHTPILTRKRVRDDVCWNDGAEHPWRRSATWLVLRVAIQRSLCSMLGSQGTLYYKVFMCFLLSSLSNEFCMEASFPADMLAFARTKLARRIAKLEAQCGDGIPDGAETVQSLLLQHDRRFTSVLQTVNNRLDAEGRQLRIQDTKRIYKLPRRADHASTTLSLHHSRGIIHQVLNEVTSRRSRTRVQLPQRPSRLNRFTKWMRYMISRLVIGFLNLQWESRPCLANDAHERKC